MRFEEALELMRNGRYARQRKSADAILYYKIENGIMYWVSLHEAIPVHTFSHEAIMADDWEEYVSSVTDADKIRKYDALNILLKNVNICDLNVRYAGCNSVCVSCERAGRCKNFFEIKKILAEIKNC